MKAVRAKLKAEISIGRFIVPFRVYGEEGPHLVCLNGAQQSMAMWHSFAQHFSPRYRIVLFDFPGQGKARIARGSHSILLDEQVAVLRGVMEAARVNNTVTLCTASWGGVVALVFAVQYPRGVKRLLLSGIGTRPSQKMVETIKKGLSIHSANRDEMAHVLIESFGQNLPDAIKNQIKTQFRTMSDENLRMFSDHGLFVLSAESLINLVDLQKIKAETILIRGEMDTIIDSEDVYLLASRIPNCTVRVVKGAGHFMHLERNDLFEFYQELLEGKNYSKFVAPKTPRML